MGHFHGSPSALEFRYNEQFGRDAEFIVQKRQSTVEEELKISRDLNRSAQVKFMYENSGTKGVQVVRKHKRRVKVYGTLSMYMRWQQSK